MENEKQSQSAEGTAARDGRDASDDVPTASKLVRLIRDSNPVFFADPTGEAYVRVLSGGIWQVHGVRSKSFKELLQRRYWDYYLRTASAAAIDAAVETLAGEAKFGGGEPQPVHVRVAGEEGAVYVDLGDPAWQVVRITRDGWEVLAKPPVMFRRPAGYGSLPIPNAGGSLSSLGEFLNARDEEHLKLLVGFLIGAFNPKGPYPVLELTGQQGSAKSTASRFLKSLIDPAHVGTRAPARNEQDLAIAAHNGWLLAFDNMSNLTGAMSDAICRMTSGGGWSGRKLYTNDEEQLFNFMRPVILNGINGIATRADLLERTISIELAQITAARRRPESELLAQFELAKPYLLGALFDAVASALRNLGGLPNYEWPRLADFARWVTASESTIGWRPGTFVDLMRKNRVRSSERALDEYDGIVEELFAVIGSSPSSRSSISWKGTATELLKLLQQRDIGWLPKSANKLSELLHRLQPALRDAGVKVQIGRNRGSRHIVLSILQEPDMKTVA